MSFNLQSAGKVKILAFLAILVLLGAAGWYIWQDKVNNDDKDKNSSTQTVSTPADWAQYKNEKYGLTFIYPKSWGEPSISEKSEEKGKTYTISFARSSMNKKLSDSENIHNVTLVFDTDDLAKKLCDPNDKNQCYTFDAFTNADIKDRLNKDKAGLVTNDDTSYATLIPNPEQSQASGVSIYQIVNLSNLNVSAVSGSYYIYGDSSGCPKDKFAPDSSDDCINKSVYDTLSKVLKSVQSL